MFGIKNKILKIMEDMIGYRIRHMEKHGKFTDTLYVDTGDNFYEVKITKIDRESE